MKASNELHQLIKSMNMSEKRHFKIHSSRHVMGERNNYMHLFDAVVRQETYDETKIKKQFSDTTFIALYGLISLFQKNKRSVLLTMLLGTGIFGLIHVSLFYGGFYTNSSEFVTQLTPYLGGGLTIALASETRAGEDRTWFKRGETFGIGIRVPGGIEWRAPKPPIGIYVELAPGISVISRTAFLFQGGVGARYYFK